MNLKRAMEFEDDLGNNSEFAWWDFRVEQMELSRHNKIVGRNRVTGTTVDIYSADMAEAMRRTHAPPEPNSETEACGWLARELNKRCGNCEGMYEFLDNRMSELERRAGIGQSQITLGEKARREDG